MLLNTVNTVNFKLERWGGSFWVFNSGQTWKYYSLDKKKERTWLRMQEINPTYKTVAQAYVHIPRMWIAKP